MIGWWFRIWSLLGLLSKVLPLPSQIRIGAIFTDDQKDCPAELAFKYAIYKINKAHDVLPNNTLVYDIQYVPKEDSFRTTKKVCNQVEHGLLALFGPSDLLLGGHIQSICDALDIPHLEARNDFENNFKEFSLNLHPSQEMMNQAYKDIMTYLNWTSAAILYEDEYGLIRLQDLVRSPPSRNIELYIRQTVPRNYRAVLREIKKKGITNILVDTDPVNMKYFFRVILQLQMNNPNYHYSFTSFDVETFDLEDFKYNDVNITAFRIVDLDNPRVKEELFEMEAISPIGTAILNRSQSILTEPALIYDSVYVFAKGLEKALTEGPELFMTTLSCEEELPWNGGSTLLKYISSIETEGLTGPISFSDNKRSDYKLDLLKLREHKMVKVGEWNPRQGLNITDPYAFTQGRPPNITLRVMTRIEQPFVTFTKIKDGAEPIGNDRFEGFCVDLLEHIAELVGFNYVIELIPDNNYGALDLSTGEWNGLVRELMYDNADLAMGAMTINFAREAVIDFTKPFMNLGISILYKIPSGKPTRLFSFMNPLAVEIWLYVLAAYMLVSFTLFVMARFSPYEWNNPHPCITENEVKENQFSVSNSFWFITGTFLRQGSGLNPKAASTRIVGAIWWFFTLIIISSYTANLAAFLTVERMITPIENDEDLAKQSEIAYGTLSGGSTMTFFRDSKIDVYKKMWNFMENHQPSVFVTNYDEGISRVKRGGYAFLMESTMLDYVVQRDCNLTQIGGLLDSKGYGIATPKGSKWRDHLSLAILELQEKGTIQMLYNKWWKNTGDVCTRQDKSKDSKANPLSVKNIGGVFVVLLCGLSLAIVVAVLEFCWNSRKNAQSDHQSLCSEMAEELRFAMRCRGARQKPALRRSCSRCSPENTYVPSSLEFSKALNGSEKTVYSGAFGFNDMIAHAHGEGESLTNGQAHHDHIYD
ncbi:glutamate receptor ionotropic, kainate 2-like [Tigriopus californicus]|uniref:glutamate receptor ionotropic, kainate 2-like n=1 Tax=Tigriopus californicus TaxID=6832 RepID=UPI0027DA11A1|nr:glutamate receptor ionotropic, kainate 2-like [Tigriopus californicus]|eukprot:TCALIF_12683-PA protein Name:"Similar to GRIK2 Glutamate receptor ionotropic, kainate 2 (Homo sapiens)" AED:0.11 eAED:0.11 QI:125/1/0.94/1/0.87/0.94/17/19/929